MSKMLAVALLAALSLGNATAAPVPKPPEGVILITSFNKTMPMEIVKPNGTSVKVITSTELLQPWQASLSPDGSRVAYLNVPKTMPGRDKQSSEQSICWRDLDAKDGTPPKIIVDVAYSPQLFWAANGKSIYYSLVDPDKRVWAHTREIEFESWIYDSATEKRTRLKIPKEHSILAVSPDGKN